MFLVASLFIEVLGQYRFIKCSDREIKMTNTMDFSKCYNPKNSVQRLELPTAFSFQLQGAPLKRTFLGDRYTNLRPVKMAKIENDLFFEDGCSR